MAPNNRTVDEATTLAMVTAFETALAESSAVGNAVESSSMALLATWKGAAASRYGQSITTWQDGLSKVKQGLQLLQGAMTDYSTSTTAAEDANSTAAGGWAIA